MSLLPSGSLADLSRHLPPSSFEQLAMRPEGTDFNYVKISRRCYVIVVASVVLRAKIRVGDAITIS